MMRFSCVFALALVACKQDPGPYKEPPPVACTEEGESPSLTSNFGILKDATYWTCNPPSEGEDTSGFTGYDGYTRVVNGGVVSVDLNGGVKAGDAMYVGVHGEVGYFATTVPDGIPTPLTFQLRQDVPFDTLLAWVAVDIGGTPDAPVIGKMIDIPIEVVRVGTGEVQVNVNWDTPSDIDLWVTEPPGTPVGNGNNQIWFGNTEGTNGGLLDLDSNAGCETGDQNENVFWEKGTAPLGRYRVAVDYFDNCDEGSDVRYQVSVIAGGEVVYTGSHSFRPSDDQEDGQTFITEFWWDGEKGYGEDPGIGVIGVDCDPVIIDYIGAVATIQQTPFGLVDGVDNGTQVDGFFSYKPCMPDSRASDSARGEFEHFETHLEVNLANGVQITGSGQPLITLNDGSSSDTFRVADGPQTEDEKLIPTRVMSIDGVETVDMDLWLSMVPSGGDTFRGDSLPGSWPLNGPITSITVPHTFSLKPEGAFGPTALLQISEMKQRVDLDGDGVGTGFSATSDCDDNNANVYPGAPETPGDTVDSNCDGNDDT